MNGNLNTTVPARIPLAFFGGGTARGRPRKGHGRADAITLRGDSMRDALDG